MITRHPVDKYIFPFDEICKVEQIYKSSDYSVLAIWEYGRWTHEFEVPFRKLRV